MTIELIFRNIIRHIVNAKNKRNFSLHIKAKYQYILDYIDKWNPLLKQYHCTIATKIH